MLLALLILVMGGSGQAPPTIDGYTYKTVKIGDQEWFAENLRTTVYANGDEILYCWEGISWATGEMGMRCSYQNDPAMHGNFGQLYNGYAVDDKRGLCPSGWHVPSDEDWQDLEEFLGMSRADVSTPGERCTRDLGIGTKLKASSAWEDDGNGTDNYGFSALPGGFRSWSIGRFYSGGSFGFWWSSSSTSWGSWFRSLRSFDPEFYRGESSKRMGYSVRCIRDAE